MLTDVDTLFKESQWFHTCKRWHTAAIGSAALLPVSPFCSCWVIWAWSKVEDQQTDRHFCISSYASSRAYMLLLSKLINPYWFQIGLCGGMKSQVCGRPTPSFVLLWKKTKSLDTFRGRWFPRSEFILLIISQSGHLYALAPGGKWNKLMDFRPPVWIPASTLVVVILDDESDSFHIVAQLLVVMDFNCIQKSTLEDKRRHLER